MNIVIKLIAAAPFVIISIYLIIDGLRRFNNPDSYWQTEKKKADAWGTLQKPVNWDRNIKRNGVLRLIVSVIVLLIALLIFLGIVT